MRELKVTDVFSPVQELLVLTLILVKGQCRWYTQIHFLRYGMYYHPNFTKENTEKLGNFSKVRQENKWQVKERSKKQVVWFQGLCTLPTQHSASEYNLIVASSQAFIWNSITVTHSKKYLFPPSSTLVFVVDVLFFKDLGLSLFVNSKKTVWAQ